MPRRVLFEGKPQNFPDDATDAEISAALGAIPAANTKDAPKARTWTDVAVDTLPAAGAIVGGTVGAIGGTAFGFGIGGVPGSIGGAALGGSAGEAAKQLINRLRGANAPNTMGEAASAIGLEGAKDAAIDATGGAIVKGAQALSPYAGSALGLAAKRIADPMALRVQAGRLLEKFADTLKAAPRQKLALSAGDVRVIQSLKAIGVSEAEAVQRVINTKARALLRGVKP
jgi:hypothetical protein